MRSYLLAALALAASALVPGCLDRPVAPVNTVSSVVNLRHLPVRGPDKIDVLLMIDNSWSMEDKQSELASRVADLLKPLTDQTVDPVTGRPLGASDIHVGVITSSLGSFGTSACAVKHGNDAGHLLPRAGDSACTPAPSSALSWAFDKSKTPGATYGGVAGADQMVSDASCVVKNAGTDGCGYEAVLESIYHFLIDPQPYSSAAATCTPNGPDSFGDRCTTNIRLGNVDHALLAERGAFLRPDSLVAVIALTDEDDGSLKVTQNGDHWVPWAASLGAMPHGYSACANVPDTFDSENPDDLHKFGCYQCGEAGPGDPSCGKAWPSPRTGPNVDGDGSFLRQYLQSQRFGKNYYWSTQRYVAGFTQTTVVDSYGHQGANGLFAGGNRTPGQVFFAAITGVPEKLVANNVDDPNPANHVAKMLTTDDWDLILGPVGKRDPHMIQSVKPRAGLPKYVGARGIDAVNGGDRDVAGGDDLQYACIQERSSVTSNDDCDPSQTDPSLNPLCVKDASGNWTQSHYKAYPGLRQLRVVQSLGNQGYAASICAKSFVPAVSGVVDLLRSALDAQCIDFVVSADSDGQVPCVVSESFAGATGPAGEASCEDIDGKSQGYCTPGREPCRTTNGTFPPMSAAQASSGLIVQVTSQGPTGPTLESIQTHVEGGNVYATSALDGKKHLVCEVRQLSGAEGKSCRLDPKYVPASGGGFCYSTDPSVIGPRCVKNGDIGTMKFKGNTLPKPGSDVSTVCIGGS